MNITILTLIKIKLFFQKCTQCTLPHISMMAGTAISDSTGAFARTMASTFLGSTVLAQ